MSRSDLVLNLLKATHNKDTVLLKRTVEAMVSDERQKQHHVLADRLSQFLHVSMNGTSEEKKTYASDEKNLFFETAPSRSLENLVLTNETITVLQELSEEHRRTDLLRSYNLEPRHRILLAGPPGNGKTSIAEGLAHSLAVPLVTVRYEGLIGSYLGETAIRLRRLFDYVSTRHCVLFFDEFDTLGKERGDLHETGEIKRVVSSLLLQMDALPSHVVVVTATNHPELLDRAVWRRFQIRLFLDNPNIQQIEAFVKSFEAKLGQPLEYLNKSLSPQLKNMSFSEIEEFFLDVLRRHILSLPDSDLKRIISDRVKYLRLKFKPARSR